MNPRQRTTLRDDHGFLLCQLMQPPIHRTGIGKQSRQPHIRGMMTRFRFKQTAIKCLQLRILQVLWRAGSTSARGAGEARRFGFMVGDIVRDVNMVDVTSPNQLQQTLNASTGWDITVQRGNRTSTLSIR